MLTTPHSKKFITNHMKKFHCYRHGLNNNLSCVCVCVSKEQPMKNTPALFFYPEVEAKKPTNCSVTFIAVST